VCLATTNPWSAQKNDHLEKIDLMPFCVLLVACRHNEGPFAYSVHMAAPACLEETHTMKGVSYKIENEKFTLPLRL
jgi:hypothetical protein